MTDAVLEIQGLEKHFWPFVLGPLNLSVPQGAMYALIGPNGAGKSTTLDLVMGMGRPDAGEIKLFGLDHRLHEAEVKAEIGYASPDLQFGTGRTVGGVLNFYRSFFATWDDEYCAALVSRDARCKVVCKAHLISAIWPFSRGLPRAGWSCLPRPLAVLVLLSPKTANAPSRPQWSRRPEALPRHGASFLWPSSSNSYL